MGKNNLTVKITCIILATLMIFQSIPFSLDVKAAEIVTNQVMDNEEIINGVGDEAIEDIIIDNDGQDELIDGESSLFLEEENNQEDISDELLYEEEIEDIFCEAEATEELAEEVTKVTSKTDSLEGFKYEEDTVYAFVDTKDKAEEIADYYGIVLESYDCSVAIYKLPEGICVSEILERSATDENGYPLLFLNRYGNVSDTIIQNVGTIEKTTDGNMSISSFITDSPLLENDPYLNENKLDYNNYAAYQWQHDVIGSPYAWTSGITGKDIKVAILSTGIGGNEGSYTSSLTPLDETRIKIIGQYYAPTGSTAQADCLAFLDSSKVHTLNGTMLAEIIGEEINGFGGVGVAPECSILNIKINEGDEAKIKESNLIKAMNYAVGQHVDIMVIDASFNYPMSDSYYDSEAEVNLNVRKVLESAYSAGIAVFAPTAWGTNQSEAWPAAYPYVTAVTATDKNNQRLSGAGYSTNTDLAAPGDKVRSSNITATGSLVATGIVAGEAALILSQKNSIKALCDAEDNPLTGSALVDALEKYMKSSTISASKECGAGIVDLTKALSLRTVTKAPTAPTIKTKLPTFNSVTNEITCSVGIQDKEYGVTVYYSINGKSPVYKNGRIDSYSKAYDLTQKAVVETIDATQKNFVIKAIAVDEKHNLVSPVTTKTVPLKTLHKIIVTAPTNRLTRGKTLQCKAKLIPNNSYTSGVTWHVGVLENVGGHVNINEGAAKASGVTISSSGKISANKKYSDTGKFLAFAVSKKMGTITGTWDFEVVMPSDDYKSLYVSKDFRTRTVDFSQNGRKLLDGVLYKDSNSNEFDANLHPDDFVVTSSNTDVVAVKRDNEGNWISDVKRQGKVTITITDAMCMGLKASYTLEVVRKASALNIEGSSYVIAGKSITLKAPLYPADASISKLTWELYDDSRKLIKNDKRIKISNGKIITTKKAVGTYYVIAKATNYDGSEVAFMGGNLDMAYPVIVASTDKLVKSIGIDSAYKNCQLFTDVNAFGDASMTSKEIYFKVNGGNRDRQLKPIPEHFQVTSSNEKVIKVESVDTYIGNGSYDYLKIVLKSVGAAGKAVINIKALDGGTAKASVKVTAVNPVSAVRIVSAKPGTNMAVLRGKSIKLEAVIVEGYGKVSNKKVTWSLVGKNDEKYATINSKTGEIKAKANFESEFSNSEWPLIVKATALDGSGAFTQSEVKIIRDYNKMQICVADGKIVDVNGKTIKKNGTIRNNYGKSSGEYSKIDFYVRIHPNKTGSWKKYITVSSSDPSLATVTLEDFNYEYPNGGNDWYGVYHFVGCCVLGTNDNKTGTVKFTVTMIDGQKLTYTLKITK